MLYGIENMNELYKALKREMRGKRATKVYISDEGDVVELVYRGTDVATVRDAGDEYIIDLNTNGWGSYTTKQRMNAVLRYFGYAIVQVDWEWLVRPPDYKGDFRKDMSRSIGKFDGAIWEHGEVGEECEYPHLAYAYGVAPNNYMAQRHQIVVKK